MYKKILTVVGITILFLGVGIQPAIAVDYKKTDVNILKNDDLHVHIAFIVGKIRNPYYENIFYFEIVNAYIIGMF